MLYSLYLRMLYICFVNKTLPAMLKKKIEQNNNDTF